MCGNNSSAKCHNEPVMYKEKYTRLCIDNLPWSGDVGLQNHMQIRKVWEGNGISPVGLQ